MRKPGYSLCCRYVVNISIDYALRPERFLPLVGKPRGFAAGMFVVALCLLVLSLESPAQPATARQLHIDGRPIRELAVDSSGAIYAASDTMLFKRRMPDSVWLPRAAHSGLPHLIAMGEGLLLSGRGIDCLGDGSSEALRRSGDGGHNWDTVFVDGATPVGYWHGRVYAISCGILTSVDHGLSWRMLPGASADGDINDLLPRSGGKLVIVSFFADTQFQEVVALEIEGRRSRSRRLLYRSFGPAALAGFEDGRLLLGSRRGVFLSEDHGKSWRAEKQGLESLLNEWAPQENDGRRFVYDICINEHNGQIYIATRNGVFRKSESSWAAFVLTDAPAVRLILLGDSLAIQTINREIFLAALP